MQNNHLNNSKNRALEALNLGLGVFGILLMVREFRAHDGLGGLGLVLLMVSAACFVAFKYGGEASFVHGRDAAAPVEPRRKSA